MDAYSIMSVREKQGLVPDLEIDGPHAYELKGKRVDISNTNYNGGLQAPTTAREAIKQPISAARYPHQIALPNQKTAGARMACAASSEWGATYRGEGTKL
jgi:hypothetical protein